MKYKIKKSFSHPMSGEVHSLSTEAEENIIELRDDAATRMFVKSGHLEIVSKGGNSSSSDAPPVKGDKAFDLKPDPAVDGEGGVVPAEGNGEKSNRTKKDK